MNNKGLSLFRFLKKPNDNKAGLFKNIHGHGILRINTFKNNKN